MVGNFTVYFPWLSVRTAFQKLLLELDDISPYISLKLPASSRYVNQQITMLNLAQRKLEIIEEKVFVFFGAGSNQSSRQAYQTLSGLIEEMTQLSINLKLLAEEYPIDPAGTVAFLPNAKVKASDLLNRINYLKAAEQEQTKNSIPWVWSKPKLSHTLASWKRQSDVNDSYPQQGLWTSELVVAQFDLSDIKMGCGSEAS